MTDHATDTFEQSRARNLPAMLAAVDRWIGDAQHRANGADLLRAKAGWIDDQLADLNVAAQLDRDTPRHLEGLTAPDLIVASGRLLTAATRLQRAA